jgi:hypothetical protein
MAYRISGHDDHAIEALAPYCRESGTILPDDVWFSHFSKRRWKIKATQAVQAFAHVPERTARSYVNGEHGVTGAVLRDCLVGDEGFELFDDIAREYGSVWWRELLRRAQIGAECERLVLQHRGVGNVATGMHNGR